MEYVVIPRLRELNQWLLRDGREKSLAITVLEEAMHCTRLRERQGVEGRNEPHVSEQ